VLHSFLAAFMDCIIPYVKVHLLNAFHPHLFREKSLPLGLGYVGKIANGYVLQPFLAAFMNCIIPHVESATFLNRLLPPPFGRICCRLVSDFVLFFQMAVCVAHSLLPRFFFMHVKVHPQLCLRKEGHPFLLGDESVECGAHRRRKQKRVSPVAFRALKIRRKGTCVPCRFFVLLISEATSCTADASR